MVKFVDKLRAELLDESDPTVKNWKRQMLEVTRRGERKQKFYFHNIAGDIKELAKFKKFAKKEGIKFTVEHKKGSDWSMETGNIEIDCFIVNASW